MGDARNSNNTTGCGTDDGKRYGAKTRQGREEKCGADAILNRVVREGPTLMVKYKSRGGESELCGYQEDCGSLPQTPEANENSAGQGNAELGEYGQRVWQALHLSSE